MQKIEKKASILIWSIFLSLIVSTLFLSISTKINHALELNKNYLDTNLLENSINNAIKNNTFTDVNLDQNTTLVFEDRMNTNYNLSKDQTLQYNFTTPGNNIDITINSGGPVRYSHDMGSGIITTSQNLNFDITTLELQNLGGHAQISISSSTNPLPEQYTKYEVIRSIGSGDYILKEGKIKNF